MLTSLIIILSLADYCQCFLLLTEVIGGTRLELFQLEPIPRKILNLKISQEIYSRYFWVLNLGKYFVEEITLAVTFLDSLVTFRNVMRPSVKFVTFSTQKFLAHLKAHLKIHEMDQYPQCQFCRRGIQQNADAMINHMFEHRKDMKCSLPPN